LTEDPPGSSPGGGLVAPPGHRFVTLAEDPTLRGPMGDHNTSVWPEFMLHDATAGRHWDRLFVDWPEFQACLLDADGAIAAAFNSAPLAWDGIDAGLPDGWDDQFERSVGDLVAGRTSNTLGAIQIVVAPSRQGQGLAGVTLAAMRRNAALHGFHRMIACVRPTEKARYPLMSIDDYAAWRRPDGLPVDLWLRIHVRLGGLVVRGSARSMTMTGTIAQWREWTGLEFPVSGSYVVPFATNPIEIDLDTDRGTYHDANIWVTHDLAT
jgi:GNAT superfamily N-acetyltransferase